LIKRINIYVFSVKVRSLAAREICEIMKERMAAYILSVTFKKHINYLKYLRK